MRKIERFDKYMKYKGLNDNKVTVQLGLTVGVLGKSRKEGRDLSNKVIEQILNFYTDLNRVWLMTGEGEMIKSVADFKSTPPTLPQSSTPFQFVQIPADVWGLIQKLTDSIAARDKQIDELKEMLKEQVDEIRRELSTPTRSCDICRFRMTEQDTNNCAI